MRPARSILAVPRLLLPLAMALLGLLLEPRTALAWLDLRVVSDVATVEVVNDGPSRVHHELMLRVRGGPLRSFTLQGVDGDGAALPGATIVLAKSGRAAGVPAALTLERDQDLLTFEIAYEKGLPSGTYLVDFAYTTDLRGTGLLKSANDGYLLNWKSPRFADGIGSLKARFIVASGEDAPALDVEAKEGQVAGEANLFATAEGVYLSELRREGDRDVLELTRPHAARGEQVTWPVRFGKASSTDAVPKGASPSPQRFTPPPPSERLRLLGWALVGNVVGVGFALLVWLKRRMLSRQRPGGGAAAFLVPLHGALRFLAIATGFGVGLWLAFGLERATAAGSALLLALILSIQHAVPEPQQPRGPGSWSRVEPDQLFRGKPRLRGLGTVLEATTIPGFVLFLVVEATSAILALRSIGNAPYQAAAFAVLLAAWVPLFFTLGGARLTLPRQRLEAAALEPYFTALAKRELPVELIARTPANAKESEPADEHRVRFLLPNARAGFDSLELALEWMHGGWFLSTRPVFIARVREGSPAHEALPRHAQWSRGRHRDERIALLRPTNAWPAASLSLAREFIQRLERPPQPVVNSTASKRANTPRVSADAKAPRLPKVALS